MAERIMRAFARIQVVFDFRPLSLSSGELRYTPPEFTYPSTEDAWEIDRENMRRDFKRAISRFESELVNV